MTMMQGLFSFCMINIFFFKKNFFKGIVCDIADEVFSRVFFISKHRSPKPHVCFIFSF